MAKDSVSWHDSKAGYEPGQEQSLKVSYVSRSGSKVKLKVSFTARSLGLDSYTKSQRWNHAHVEIYRRNSNGSRGSRLYDHDWTYQIHGNGGTSSHTDSFYVGNLKDGETHLIICYRNERVGTNTPYYGPKSTGKVERTQLSEILDIDDNDKVSIKFHTGGVKSTLVSNLPKNTTIYRGHNYRIPSNKVTHTKNYYTFRGGYDTSDSWKNNHEVDITSPSVNVGSVIKNVNKNLNLYACWKPNTFYYHYYPTYDDAINRTNEYTDLCQKRVHNTPGVPTPDLNTVDNKKYARIGYEFLAWEHLMPEGKANAHHSMSVDDPDAEQHRDCRRAADTHCWPIWKALNIKLTFDYCYSVKDENDEFKKVTTTYDYLCGDKFNLEGVCKDRYGKSGSATSIRPGFKLIGWSYTDPKKIYDTGKTQKSDYAYAYNYNGVLSNWPTSTTDKDGNTCVTLYAVWEYYTQMYVYTNGSWRLVTPYVYNNFIKHIKIPLMVHGRIKYYNRTSTRLQWNEVLPYAYKDDDWKWSGNSTTQSQEPEPLIPSELETYAKFDSATNIFTFFNDTKNKYDTGDTEGTITYFAGVRDTRKGVPWEGVKSEIKEVVVKDEFDPYITANWFSGCTNLLKITDLTKIKFDIVIDVSNMFKECSSIESIDFESSNFGWTENFDSLFEDCSSIKSINFLNVKTPLAISTYRMFSGCSSLEKLSISMQTDAVKDMSYMFNGCSSLEELDISIFNTELVTNMSYMFNSCSSLTKITGIDSIKTTNVTNMNSMFKDCSSMILLDLTSFNTSNVTDMTSMFENCLKLHTIYAIRTNKNTTNVYSGHFKLDRLPYTEETTTEGEGENAKSVTTKVYRNSDNMFSGCISLNSIGYGVSKVEKHNNKKNDKSNYIQNSNVSKRFLYNSEKTNASYARVAYIFEEESKVDKLNKKGEKILDYITVKIYKKDKLESTKKFNASEEEKAKKLIKEYKDKNNYTTKKKSYYKQLTVNKVTLQEGYFIEK